MALTPEQIKAFREKYKIGQAPSAGAAPQGQEAPDARIKRLQESTRAPATQPEVQQPEAQPEKFQEGDGLFKTLIKDPIKTLLVKPAARATEAVGRSGIFGKTIQRGFEEQAETGQDLDTAFGKYHIEPVKGFDNGGARQLTGEALKSASYLFGGGSAAKAAGSVKGGQILRGIGQGARAGAIGGGLYGTGEGLEEGKGLGESLALGARDAAIGGAFGGALGGGAAGIGKGIRARSAAKQRVTQQAEKLAEGSTDASIATKQLQEGKVVKDPKASEVVRQGIPEDEVALIKGASEKDARKMMEMFDIRKKGLTDKRFRISNRASDVVGETFLDQAKFIQKTNREAGQKLDAVAKGLSGKKVDPTEAFTGFGEELSNTGISLNEKGLLDFSGSDFENIKTSQTIFNNIWTRMNRILQTRDALQVHRLKRYIDENVTYGKGAEGLSGKAQALLKGLRKNADDLLDNNFNIYKKVNEQYSDTRNILDVVLEDIVGKKMNISDDFAKARVGTKFRSVMSNSDRRTTLLPLVRDLQDVAKKYGMDIEEDILNQAGFADTLERMFGPEADTGFEKLIGRGLQGAEAAADFGTGRIIRGTLKAGKSIVDATRGVNQEAQEKAMLDLLRSMMGKKVSNFGIRK